MTRGTFGVLLALTVSTSAAVTFAFLYFTRLSRAEIGVVKVEVADDPTGPVKPGTIQVFVGEGPFVQKDTVSPRSQHTGVVYYPVPYAVTPNLKITSRPREYVVVKQNEFGFTWAARPLDTDFKNGKPESDSQFDEPIERLAKTAFRPNVQYDDFTWEARGVPASVHTLRVRLYEQTGTFQTSPGQEGEVIFPIPYNAPPNIELTGPSFNNTFRTVVMEVKPTGFKWKNTGTTASFDAGEARWRSRGVPAVEPPVPGKN